jgi:hypothetical protein
VTLEDDAASVMRTYAGLGTDDAAALVAAVQAAVVREALDVIAGDAPVASNLTDSRALRLRRICEELGRTLTPREVEVVFRLPPQAAGSVDRRMRATYPQAVDGFMRSLVSDTATATKTGDADKGFRYDVFFDDRAALEFAVQILQREGMTRNLKQRSTEQVLDVPRSMRDRQGTDRDPLDVLGVTKPT